MSEHLEQVVSYFVESKEIDNLGNKPGNTREEMLKKAAKESIINAIYKEIYDEVEEEAFLSAEKRSKEKSTERKMREAKNLIIKGFIVAFFVGMAVNQLTEVISIFKNGLTTGNLMDTIIMFIIFLCICIGLLGYMFIKEVLALIRKDTGR